MGVGLKVEVLVVCKTSPKARLAHEMGKVAHIVGPSSCGEATIVLSIPGRGRRRLAALLASIATMLSSAGCATARPAPAPVFTTGIWRIRIDVDSAPTRRQPKQLVFGTIDFAAHRYAIDFQHSIGRVLSSAALIAPIGETQRTSPEYRIILGDSSSFDDKIVMRGRLVAHDSIVGTWTETILCCSAAGRISLWRTASAVGRR
jgi:hypothetical protein